MLAWLIERSIHENINWFFTQFSLHIVKYAILLLMLNLHLGQPSIYTFTWDTKQYHDFCGVSLKALEYWALFNLKGGNQNSVFDILQLCLPAKAWYEWLIKKRTNYCKLNSWSVEYSRFWLLFIDWVWHWPALYSDFSWILSSDLLPTSKSHKQAPVHCPWQHTVKIWRENCPEQKYTHIFPEVLCSPTDPPTVGQLPTFLDTSPESQCQCNDSRF